MKKLFMISGLLATLSTAATASNIGNASSISAGQDSVRTQNGASCSSTRHTGRQAEFGFELDETTENLTLGGKLVFILGTDKVPDLNCQQMLDNETALQRLELRKARLELQLLERQLANSNTATKAASTPEPIGNDW